MRSFCAALRAAGPVQLLLAGLAVLSVPATASVAGWLTGPADDWPVRPGLAPTLTWVEDNDPDQRLSQPRPGDADLDRHALNDSERARVGHLDDLLKSFHARLGGQFPQRMQGVPVPRVQVVDSASPFARARQAMVCLRFDRPPAVAGGEAAWLGINGNGTVFAARPDNCLARDLSQIDREALNFLLARNNGSCLLSLDEQQRIALGPGCDDRRPDAPLAGLALPAAANVLEVSRPLLAEGIALERLEAVVLHEAAHYYLAHPATWTANNAYFYFAAELHQRPGPPPPAGHAAQEAGRELVLAARRGCRRPQCQRLHQQLARLGLERYTVEQAADEYTVRALLLMGRDPGALISHVRARGSADPAWSASDCAGRDAKAMRIAPQGWSRPHHDRCFRIHRIERYIEQLQVLGGATS
ncbi:MAG: hypothetical protein ACLFQC_01880 [Wenzhouxiangella sp.]